MRSRHGSAGRHGQNAVRWNHKRSISVFAISCKSEEPPKATAREVHRQCGKPAARERAKKRHKDEKRQPVTRPSAQPRNRNKARVPAFDKSKAQGRLSAVPAITQTRKQRINIGSDNAILPHRPVALFSHRSPPRLLQGFSPKAEILEGPSSFSMRTGSKFELSSGLHCRVPRTHW
jgi:hypothetical protein